LREAAVGLLLDAEEVVERALGRSLVARGVEGRGDLIKVARPNQMIAADVRLVGARAAAPGLLYGPDFWGEPATGTGAGRWVFLVIGVTGTVSAI